LVHSKQPNYASNFFKCAAASINVAVERKNEENCGEVKLSHKNIITKNGKTA